jgi:hypothetical protein
VRSFHHFNLSQDPDEAIAKATEAAGRMGMPLLTTRAEITEKLAAIQRATADEMREREEREKRWREEREAVNAAHMQRWLQQIEEGCFPDCFRNCGDATGKWIETPLPNGYTTENHWRTFESAEVGYLNWLMDGAEGAKFEPDSLLAITAARVLQTCQHLRLPRPDAHKVTGEVGKRQVFEVTVTRVFEFSGIYGITYFVTMVTPDGCCLLSKGRFKSEVGDKLKIKATVKEHDDYKGQAQTVVQRVVVEAWL